MRALNRGSSRGSALLFVLLACLALAVMIQALCTVVICAQRAAIDESIGRVRLAERDQGLLFLRRQALVEWKVSPWSAVPGDSGASSPSIEASLNEIPGAVTPVLEAWVRHDPDVCGLETRAWVERGRDGIDLPVAVLVAGKLNASSSRRLPWLECEQASSSVGSSASASAVGYVVQLPVAPMLGEGCRLVELPGSWQLDPGWRLLSAEMEDDSHSPDVVPGPGVMMIQGGRGELIRLSELIQSGVGSKSSPVLAVVTGGADLDARDCCDLHGVIVVDEGSLILDGTILHGAAFATECVDLGESGMIVYLEEVLRWATDRSLQRVRLVPGSRREDTVG